MIDNEAVESHNFFLVVVWKPLSKNCLLLKRQAIPLHEMLAPVVSCSREAPGLSNEKFGHLKWPNFDSYQLEDNRRR